MNFTKLFGSKTFWTALIALSSSGIALAFGEIGVKEVAGAVFIALQTIFLRDAISKNGIGELTVFEVEADEISDSRQP